MGPFLQIKQKVALDSKWLHVLRIVSSNLLDYSLPISSSA